MEEIDHRFFGLRQSGTHLPTTVSDAETTPSRKALITTARLLRDEQDYYYACSFSDSFYALGYVQEL